MGQRQLINKPLDKYISILAAYSMSSKPKYRNGYGWSLKDFRLRSAKVSFGLVEDRTVLRR